MFFLPQFFRKSLLAILGAICFVIRVESRQSHLKIKSLDQQVQSVQLDHELRLYVRELRDRSYAVDELNRAIDRLCRENDINIAFNQLEVHLRNEKGDEITEVKRDANGGDAAPAIG